MKLFLSLLCFFFASSDFYYANAETAFDAIAQVSTGQDSYTSGTSVTVNFSGGPGNASDWIGIYSADAASLPGNYLDWLYVSGTQSATAAITDGSVTFASGIENVGEYVIYFFSNNGYTVLASTEVSITAACQAGTACDDNDACTTNDVLDADCNCQGELIDADGDGLCDAGLYTAADQNVAEALEFTFTGGSGSSTDWIGIYAAGTTSLSGSYLDWLYVSGTQTASSAITAGSVSFADGLTEAGNYTAYFFENNGYSQLASVDFTISENCVAGTACDDNDPCTENDVLDADCNCAGTFRDANADGICDPYLLSAEAVYEANGTVSFDFAGGTGSAADWIGIYPAGVTSLPGNYTEWLYVSGTQSATTAITEGTVSFPDGLSATGEYTAYLFANNGYTTLASVDFSVITTCETGSVCDDNNACTVNDVYDENCNCAGELLDADGDGECDILEEYPVKLLSFNVWQEGTQVSNGLNKIRDVILEVNPDVVAFSEVRNYNGQDWTQKIVNALSAAGQTYYRGYAGSDVSIISKFPITDSSLTGNGSMGRFDIDIAGSNVVVCVAHLQYVYYACYLPRGYNGGVPNWNMFDDGNGNPEPVTDVDFILDYNLQGSRDEDIADFLSDTENETDPVILMGDFNEPSHLDWTEDTKDMFDHSGTVINWNTSASLVAAGFTDAYRDFYPDEVNNPGATWPSEVTGQGSPAYIPLADERDRIDFIYYKGSNAQTTDAALVGPENYYVREVLTTDETENDTYLAKDLDWPSDHKAVYSKLLLDLTEPEAIGLQSLGTENQIIHTAPETGSANVSLFPNPNDSSFVNFTFPAETTHYRIYDALGRMLHAGQTASRQINISDLSPGVYQIELTGNGQRVTKRLIRQ